MKHLAGVAAVVFTLAASVATSTRAATMEFTDVPFLDFGPYSESGITVFPSGGDLGGDPGSIHVDDGGTSFAGKLEFRMDSRFDAINTRVLPAGSAYCIEVAEAQYTCPEFDNIEAAGFRDGVEVAVEIFYMGKKPNTHFFGSDFSDLDFLTIAILGPPAIPFAECLDNPCSHFSLDSITLRPATVPLPASIWLLLGGVAALGGAARRRSA